ncbi:cycle-inhibiting factor [Photorhabdus kleinii]|uniref:cycle-inhibiting factor n=1 Tax=Photorhabdus kleinii TaxID=768034 RepID=UPI0021D48840|nr:cycle-inhibiting factor [Photorhabdus kleinii]MCT8341584.1 cycle-inhibiting factor [Photorhabdus kleinii]
MPISNFAKKFETSTKKDKTLENITTGDHLEIAPSICLSESKDISKLKKHNLSSVELINGIIALHNDPKGNKLLWNDNWQNKIVDRDLAAIFKAIDETVSELGGIEIYQEIVGINPYDPTEPVCGLSAQNIFKLMTEGEHAVDPVKTAQVGKIDGNEFAERVDQLSGAKNYVALVNDHRLGHMFLIDIPSNDQETVGYIYQSDLGEGALPPLKIADWLSARGKDPVTLNKLKKLLSHEFNLLSENEQQELIAEIFDIHKEISDVGLDKIKKDKRIDIYLTEYNINDFYENIEKLKAKFDSL